MSITFGYSPGHLSYQRDMMIPGRILLDWDQINATRLKASNYSLTYSNKRCAFHTYKVGDKVLLIRRSLLSKLQKPTVGIFIIYRVHKNGTVRLNKGNYGETVSIRNIKPRVLQYQ